MGFNMDVDWLRAQSVGSLHRILRNGDLGNESRQNVDIGRLIVLVKRKIDYTMYDETNRHCIAFGNMGVNVSGCYLDK